MAKQCSVGISTRTAPFYSPNPEFSAIQYCFMEVVSSVAQPNVCLPPFKFPPVHLYMYEWPDRHARAEPRAERSLLSPAHSTVALLLRFVFSPSVFPLHLDTANNFAVIEKKFLTKHPNAFIINANKRKQTGE